MSKPTRTIHHADALVWLKAHEPLPGSSMITSLPDVSELGTLSLADWKVWFVNAAALVLERCPADGLTIFYQSDIKREGAWVDKGFLVQKAAERVGHELLAHKIICRAPAGRATFGRPAYSHLLCFSRDVRFDVALATADVLPAAGATTWTRGMGVEACRLACQLVQKHTNSHTIVDPFCGHGTALVVANDMGFHAVGVEISRKRAEKARQLAMTDKDLAWS